MGTGQICLCEFFSNSKRFKKKGIPGNSSQLFLTLWTWEYCVGYCTIKGIYVTPILLTLNAVACWMDSAVQSHNVNYIRVIYTAVDSVGTPNFMYYYILWGTLGNVAGCNSRWREIDFSHSTIIHLSNTWWHLLYRGAFYLALCNMHQNAPAGVTLGFPASKPQASIINTITFCFCGNEKPVFLYNLFSNS